MSDEQVDIRDLLGVNEDTMRLKKVRLRVVMVVVAVVCAGSSLL